MNAIGMGGIGMKRRTFWIGWLAALAVAISGCSNTTGTTAAATVMLAPPSATVAVGATEQFEGTVTGPTDTSIIWEVNSVTGGDSIHGTISTAGLYTAPATVPVPNTVTVTAVSNVIRLLLRARPSPLIPGFASRSPPPLPAWEQVRS